MRIRKIFCLLFIAFISLMLSGCNLNDFILTKTTIAKKETTLTNTITTKKTSKTNRETTTIETNKTTVKNSSSNKNSSKSASNSKSSIKETKTSLERTSSSKQVINYYKNFDIDLYITYSKDDLVDEIYDLISDASISVSYVDSRDYFYLIDQNPTTGKVQLFYSHLEVSASKNNSSKTGYRLNMGSSSGEYNREHVWPQSLGDSKDEPGGHDLHHIRPTLVDLNSSRGNLLYGNCKNSGTKVTYKNVTYAYKTSKLFEPMDDVKGDVARILFYYAIKYNYDLKVVVGDKTFKEILEWNRLDPVSEVEINRNNKVEDIQGNRNIFIDYPGLAEYIW